MVDNYQKLYKNNKERLESDFALGRLREQGIRDFTRLGIPNLKMEKWKNFNLKAIEKKEFVLNLNNSKTKLLFFENIKDIDSFDAMIFINGKCSYEMQMEEYKNGIVFGSIKAVFAKYPELVLSYFNKANKQNLNGLNALNSAMVQDGFFLLIPENIHLEKPFLIVNNYNSELEELTNNRNIIVLEQNSGCEIIQMESASENCKSFSNNITEIFIENDANLSLNKLQKYLGDSIAIESMFVKQKGNSVFNDNIATIGGNKLRNDIHIKIKGKHSFANVNGAFILSKNNEIDNNIFIEHSNTDCDSNQNFKGILDNKSKGAFTGYVLVKKDSQRTNAYQSNKNILLSENANMSTNPFLEIYADDVKCSHGASVGSLDENALFYIKSRGIAENKAKELLLNAFVFEVFEDINSDNFKELVSKEIERKLLNI